MENSENSWSTSLYGVWNRFDYGVLISETVMPVQLKYYSRSIILILLENNFM